MNHEIRNQIMIQKQFNHEPEKSFNGLGIAPKLLEILAQLKFSIPTPIQYKAIPPAIEGKDIIGIAQTGTGKTLAFGIPMIQRLMQMEKSKGLVILPTRELAIQISEALQKVGRDFNIRTAVLIGGAPMHQQIQMIRNHPDIIIGTPGRIIDHLEHKTLSSHDVAVLVLDEADRMFDMGFAPQITRILQTVQKNHQTMLFSATMPDGIVKIAVNHMKLPVRVEIARSGTTAEHIDHEIFIARRDQKNRLLDKLLAEYKGSVLIFLRSKYGVSRICRDIRNMGFRAAEIHSNRSLGQRREALEGFKLGKYRVLVATDIASRGIDVKNIELVINYDLPEHPEDYVHRIGRTGRAGMAGRAISFALPDQKLKVRAIEKLIQASLPVSQLPELPPARSTSSGQARFSTPFIQDRSSGYVTNRRSNRGSNRGPSRSSHYSFRGKKSFGRSRGK